MSEIAAASAEQSSGIEQVNQAITQMDDVTQQNAALVEEAAAAAESLQEQAGKLAEAVSVVQAGRIVLQRSAGGSGRQAVVATLPNAACTGQDDDSPKKLAVAGGANEEWEEF